MSASNITLQSLYERMLAQDSTILNLNSQVKTLKHELHKVSRKGNDGRLLIAEEKLQVVEKKHDKLLSEVGTLKKELEKADQKELVEADARTKKMKNLEKNKLEEIFGLRKQIESSKVAAGKASAMKIEIDEIKKKVDVLNNAKEDNNSHKLEILLKNKQMKELVKSYAEEIAVFTIKSFMRGFSNSCDISSEETDFEDFPSEVPHTLQPLLQYIVHKFFIDSETPDSEKEETNEATLSIQKFEAEIDRILSTKQVDHQTDLDSKLSLMQHEIQKHLQDTLTDGLADGLGKLDKKYKMELGEIKDVMKLDIINLFKKELMEERERKDKLRPTSIGREDKDIFGTIDYGRIDIYVKGMMSVYQQQWQQQVEGLEEKGRKIRMMINKDWDNLDERMLEYQAQLSGNIKSLIGPNSCPANLMGSKPQTSVQHVDDDPIQGASARGQRTAAGHFSPRRVQEGV